MSNFTFASLVPTKNKEIVKNYLDPGAYLIEFTDQWVCLLNENDGALSVEGEIEFSENVMALSSKTPVLYIAYPEDDGFGYAILNEGKLLSSIYIEASFKENLAMRIAFEMHGEKTGLDLWMDDMEKYDAIAEKEFDKYFERIFANNYVDYFSLFGYSEEVIKQLRELLSPENIRHDYLQGEAFLGLLGLQNLSFVSWDYVSDFEENYTIIAKG